MSDNYVIVNGELYHAGIKGMRWGVRRFQNEDGTLTEAGKKRYGVGANGKQTAEGKQLQKVDTEKAKLKEAEEEIKRLRREAKAERKAARKAGEDFDHRKYETRGRSTAKAVLAGTGAATVGTFLGTGAALAAGAVVTYKVFEFLSDITFFI